MVDRGDIKDWGISCDGGNKIVYQYTGIDLQGQAINGKPVNILNLLEVIGLSHPTARTVVVAAHYIQ